MMKKILAGLLLCVVVSLSAFSQQEPTFTLSKAEKGKLEIRLALKSPATISIDWGNNKPKKYEVNANAKIAEATVVSENVDANAVVKVYAEDLVFLYCREQALSSLNLLNAKALRAIDCSINYLTELNTSNSPELNFLNCNKNLINALNLSSNAKLKTFNCSYNSLETLDFSNNKALEHVSVFENKLTSLTLGDVTKIHTILASKNKLPALDISNTPALTYLDINANLFDACALNKLFAALPINNKTSEVSNLKINHNVGAPSSNTTTAEEKKWILDRQGKGNAKCNKSNMNLNLNN